VIVSLTQKIKFLESVFGKGVLGKNSLNFDVKCPIETCKSHKDSNKKKLSIHTPDFMCHCWTCGYSSRSIATLLWKYASREKLQEFKNSFATVKDTVDPNVQASRIVSLPQNFKLLVTCSSRDFFANAARRYVTSRGLTEDDMWYYKLGISDAQEWDRRVIMPSFDSNGKLNYYAGRAISEKFKPSYMYPDIQRTSLVFNELNVDWTKRLVLCEGPFDLVKCTDNAVPMLGSRLNEKYDLFNKIVINRTPVAIAMDADTWATKMQQVIKKFREYDVDTLVVDTRAFKDPGSMSKSEFRDALKAAKPLDWYESFTTKLDFVSGTRLSI